MADTANSPKAVSQSIMGRVAFLPASLPLFAVMIDVGLTPLGFLGQAPRTAVRCCRRSRGVRWAS